MYIEVDKYSKSCIKKTIRWEADGKQDKDGFLEKNMEIYGQTVLAFNSLAQRWLGAC